jgi:hypothetical protein
MKTVQKKPVEEFRMSSADFDRIMGRALQVKPEAAKSKSKRSAKAKASKKKSVR